MAPPDRELCIIARDRNVFEGIVRVAAELAAIAEQVETRAHRGDTQKAAERIRDRARDLAGSATNNRTHIAGCTK